MFLQYVYWVYIFNPGVVGWGVGNQYLLFLKLQKLKSLKSLLQNIKNPFHIIKLKKDLTTFLCVCTDMKGNPFRTNLRINVNNLIKIKLSNKKDASHISDLD